MGWKKLKNYDKLDEEKRTKIDEALSEFDEPVEDVYKRQDNSNNVEFN